MEGIASLTAGPESHIPGSAPVQGTELSGRTRTGLERARIVI